MPGRKPKPVALLKIEGGYRPDRHARREHEPSAGGGLGNPPEWLTDDQKALWRELAATATVLGAADRSLFLGMVLLRDTLQVAAMAGDHKLIRQTALALTRVGSELGYSPIARARLGTSAKTNEDDDFATYDFILPNRHRS